MRELDSDVATVGELQPIEDLRGGTTCPELRRLRDAVREVAPPLAEDRRQDQDVAAVLERLRSGALPLGRW